MRKIGLILSIILLAVVHSTKAQKSKDIVDVAVSVGDFSTLVTALKEADLISALKGDGPFTVFAPKNKGFANIDLKTLNSLLEPANKEKLERILTYHVVSGRIASKDFADILKSNNGEVELTTLSGDTLTALYQEGGIYLKDENGNYSKISKTDIMASNGVIHTIEDVIMPRTDEVYCCSNHKEKHCGTADNLANLRKTQGCKGFN